MIYMTTQVATIPKKISGGHDLVVVKRKDYQLFQKWQAEISDALAKVRRGHEEYRSKRTVVTSSPRKFR